MICALAATAGEVAAQLVAVLDDEVGQALLALVEAHLAPGQDALDLRGRGQAAAARAADVHGRAFVVEALERPRRSSDTVDPPWPSRRQRRAGGRRQRTGGERRHGSATAGGVTAARARRSARRPTVAAGGAAVAGVRQRRGARRGRGGHAARRRRRHELRAGRRGGRRAGRLCHVFALLEGGFGRRGLLLELVPADVGDVEQRGDAVVDRRMGGHGPREQRAGAQVGRPDAERRQPSGM